jgi:hypothetical protein
MSSQPDSTIIYVVHGCVDYEGCDVITSFVNSDDAEKFKNQCVQYKKTQPASYDGDYDDETWLEYCNVMIEWRSHHPAKSESYDSFHISVVELRNCHDS